MLPAMMKQSLSDKRIRSSDLPTGVTSDQHHGFGWDKYGNDIFFLRFNDLFFNCC